MSTDFFPNKVYCCPCLTYLLLQTHNADIQKWETIKQVVTIHKTSSMLVFSTHVENRASCICAVHLI